MDTMARSLRDGVLPPIRAYGVARVEDDAHRERDTLNRADNETLST
jgi:hypothetical protein